MASRAGERRARGFAAAAAALRRTRRARRASQKLWSTVRGRVATRDHAEEAERLSLIPAWSVRSVCTPRTRAPCGAVSGVLDER